MLVARVGLRFEGGGPKRAGEIRLALRVAVERNQQRRRDRGLDLPKWLTTRFPVALKQLTVSALRLRGEYAE